MAGSGRKINNTHNVPLMTLQHAVCKGLCTVTITGNNGEAQSAPQIGHRQAYHKKKTMLIEVHFCGHQQVPNDIAPVSTLNLATIGKGASRLHSRPTWTKQEPTEIDIPGLHTREIIVLK